MSLGFSAASSCGGDTRGVLVIEGGDTKAAFAAFVFMYVSNHLIYLEYLRGRQFTPASSGI